MYIGRSSEHKGVDLEFKCIILLIYDLAKNMQILANLSSITFLIAELKPEPPFYTRDTHHQIGQSTSALPNRFQMGDR